MEVPQPPLVFTAAPGGTLLLVDDEPNVLSSLKRLFRSDGYALHLARSGPEALALLESVRADVVISDMRMPGMDGAELLQQVRARWPQIVRVLLTGHADIASTIAAINKGEIYRYIAKPWDDQDVRLLVRHALERTELERERDRLVQLTQTQNDALRQLNASLEQKVELRTRELAEAMGSLQKTHERLNRNFLTSIRVFGNLLELRNGTVAGHSRRVAELARRLAEQLGLSPSDAQDVMVAGVLHDIGKLALPDGLQAKPLSELSASERAVVTRHPEKGEAALMPLEPLAGAALLIRSHHELYNGTGYPHGLRGDQIPLGARILAVANDYDALRQGGIYAKRYSASEAAAYVRQGAGKRYDPDVVDAFFALLAEASPRSPDGGEISVHSDKLRDGMSLAHDLTARDGMILLARDYVLDDGVIRRIRAYEESEGYRLTIHVRLPTEGDDVSADDR